MANLVIVSNNSYINIKFNDASTKVNCKEIYISRSRIDVNQDTYGCIQLYFRGTEYYSLCMSGMNNSLVVDTINGEALTDNNDILSKLGELVL